MIKGYSEQTIRKVFRSLQEKIAFYRNLDISEYKMTISQGNEKIGHVLNVSLAPLVTCGNCSNCCKFCYDIKACLAYPSCLDSRARNTALFMENRDEFFKRLHEKMARRKKNFFLRFHVSGEIVDLDHFSRMVETAKLFPHYVIWTYTKMYWIVNEYVRQHGGDKSCIPSNFSVMFSAWHGVPMANPYGFPVFACAFEESEKVGFKCPGNCEYCKKFHTGCIAGESTYTLPH